MKSLETLDRFTPERIDALWEAQSDLSKTFEQTVADAGLWNETELAACYAGQHLLPLFDPPADKALPIDPEVARHWPAAWFREHGIAPLADDGATLDVAIASPEALRLVPEVRQRFGRHMRACFAAASIVRQLLDASFPEVGDNAPPADDAPAEEPADFSDEALERVMQSAVDRGARSLHFQVDEDRGCFWVRVGDQCTPDASLDRAQILAACERLRALATTPSMDPLAGTGNFSLRIDGRRFVAELCWVGTEKGQAMTVRFPTALPAVGASLSRLEAIGFSSRRADRLRHALQTKTPGWIVMVGRDANAVDRAIEAVAGELCELQRDAVYVGCDRRNVSDGTQPFVQEDDRGSPSTRIPAATFNGAEAIRVVAKLEDRATAWEACRRAIGGERVVMGLVADDRSAALRQLREWGIPQDLLTETIDQVVRVPASATHRLESTPTPSMSTSQRSPSRK